MSPDLVWVRWDCGALWEQEGQFYINEIGDEYVAHDRYAGTHSQIFRDIEDAKSWCHHQKYGVSR